MLDRREIDIEIARLEYMESSYPNYAKLADLYTIREQMNRTESLNIHDNYGMSNTASKSLNRNDSEFLMAIANKNSDDVLQIIDDLMDTMRVANPRVYNSVIRKIQSIQ